MTASFAGREKSNVPVKLLRPKQTETDQETSHIINHTQPMRGGKWPELSLQNILFFTICSGRGTFVFCIIRSSGGSLYNTNTDTVKILPSLRPFPILQHCSNSQSTQTTWMVCFQIWNLFAKKKIAEFEIRFIV